MAEGTPGVVTTLGQAGRFIMSPGTGNRNYRYHLRHEDFQLFVKDVAQPGDLPNILVRLHAEALWKHGPRQATDRVLSVVTTLGGTVGGVKPSRVDLCTDFHLPDGLNLDFLNGSKVSRSDAISHHGDRQGLHTFYAGADKAPIRARIYNKGREVGRAGGKTWFKDIWGTNDVKDAWRIEFQLRRPALRDCGIDTTEDLFAGLGGLWVYLTNEWFSLRVQGNHNPSRRPLHPWWDAVQQAAECFGPSTTITRRFRRDGNQNVLWYVQHVAGCIESFAARTGTYDPAKAVEAMGRAVMRVWQTKDFHAAVTEKAIALNKTLDQEGVSHAA